MMIWCGFLPLPGLLEVEPRRPMKAGPMAHRAAIVAG